MKQPQKPKPPGPSSLLNESESPLYRLYCRKDISGKSAINEIQFLAGERLRSDFEAANLARKITQSWNFEQYGAPAYASLSDNHIANLTDKAIDARHRVHAAFDSVGPELSGILYYVCCLAGGLETAERILSLPQRSGKAVLAPALTRLARHYRLLKAPYPVGKSQTIEHWALDDHRPSIMPSG